MNETRQWLISAALSQYKKHMQSARASIAQAYAFRTEGDPEAVLYFLDNARRYREMAVECEARYDHALANQ
jgi:hypothetical protein